MSDILYVTTSYPPAIGGAQIHLHYLARAMRAAGHSPHVITHWSTGQRSDWIRGTTVNAGPARRYEVDHIPVSQIGFPLATRLEMAPWALAYYGLMKPAVRAIADRMAPAFEAAAGAPRLVHASRIGREFIVQAALDFARKRGLPFVLTPNHHPRWRGRLYREYDRIYREADAVIALTTAERDTLVNEKGVSANKVHVTGIGPVLAQNYSSSGFRIRNKLEAPFVLFLGQQYRYKGVAAVLDAAPQVWKAFPEVRFVFAGPHTHDSRQIFREKQDPRVLNLGAVDLETKTAALAECECLVLPSMQESFGGVFVEAWSLRKPVIAGNIPPLACVVDHGRDGLLTSQDPSDVAKAILRLLTDRGAARAMGESGYQKVQQRFTWERIAEQTLAIYEQLWHERTTVIGSGAA